MILIHKIWCCERVMDLKYYSLDRVSVFSVPSVVQSSGPFCFCTVETWIETKWVIISYTQGLKHLLTRQTL